MEVAATAQLQHYYAEYHGRETLSPSERHCEPTWHEAIRVVCAAFTGAVFCAPKIFASHSIPIASDEFVSTRAISRSPISPAARGSTLVLLD